NLPSSRGRQRPCGEVTGVVGARRYSRRWMTQTEEDRARHTPLPPSAFSATAASRGPPSYLYGVQDEIVENYSERWKDGKSISSSNPVATDYFSIPIKRRFWSSLSVGYVDEDKSKSCGKT